MFLSCHYHEKNCTYTYVHDCLNVLVFYFQSEEDKQLQEELNMLVERLQVSVNFTISHIKVASNFLLYSMYFNNGNKRRWVKIMFCYRTSDVKSQYNRIKPRGKMSIKYPVMKFDVQFL